MLRREKTASFGFDTGIIERVSDFEVGFSLDEFLENQFYQLRILLIDDKFSVFNIVSQRRMSAHPKTLFER